MERMSSVVVIVFTLYNRKIKHTADAKINNHLLLRFIVNLTIFQFNISITSECFLV